VLSELKSIAAQTPVTRNELSRARKELLGGYAKSLELGSDVIGEFSDTFINELPPSYLSQLGDTLNRVELAELQIQVQQFLTRTAPLLVVVGDKAKLGDALGKLAPNIADAPPRLLD
jgi:predicted Zn-dependent peptidase